jgi:hypothetical protein
MNPQPDPTLNKLHDYYQPAPPPWIPQTIGWYVLFAIFALVLIWLVLRAVRRWLANRYRREALRELAIATPDQFSVLLKRTALAAWPREKVASLSGDDWLSFLSKTVKGNAFQTAPGNRIEELALHQDNASADDEQALRAITAQWIRRHRVRD